VFGIRDGEKIWIRDEHHRSFFREIIGLKILNSLMRLRIWNLSDSGFGMEKFGSGIRPLIPDPQHCRLLLQKLYILRNSKKALPQGSQDKNGTSSDTRESQPSILLRMIK
jgi:hypothetical protein